MITDPPGGDDGRSVKSTFVALESTFVARSVAIDGAEERDSGIGMTILAEEATSGSFVDMVASIVISCGESTRLRRKDGGDMMVKFYWSYEPTPTRDGRREVRGDCVECFIFFSVDFPLRKKSIADDTI